MTQANAHSDMSQKLHWVKRLGRSLGQNIWDFICTLVVSAWLNG
ncbi:hypothetical protein ACVWZX_000098 [Deinococcus sp. UYEF24]